MSIVERIRRSQQEEASREASRKASAKAEEIKWQQEKRQTQQENAQKTSRILEESGVKAALIEIRDKMTGRLFGIIGGGKLTQFEGETSRIGGIKLAWDREEFPHWFGRGYPPIIRWKEMRIHVTSKGDLILDKKGRRKKDTKEWEEEIFDQIITRESWQEDRALVEKELAEYFQSPIIVEDRAIIAVANIPRKPIHYVGDVDSYRYK